MTAAWDFVENSFSGLSDPDAVSLIRRQIGTKVYWSAFFFYSSSAVINRS